MRRVMGQLTGPFPMAGCAMASELSRTSSTNLGMQPSGMLGCTKQSAAPRHIKRINTNVFVPHKNHGV